MYPVFLNIKTPYLITMIVLKYLGPLSLYPFICIKTAALLADNVDSDQTRSSAACDLEVFIVFYGISLRILLVYTVCNLPKSIVF